jgi:hypothetical protein
VCVVIIRTEIAEMFVSSPITGSLCNSSQEQSVPSATLVPSLYLKEDPLYPRRNFTTIPICGIDAFMPPRIRGGPLCYRRGRNFTAIPIHGIDAFMPPPSHRRWCSRMELYLLSKFASALEKLEYQCINLRRICILLIMHV